MPRTLEIAFPSSGEACPQSPLRERGLVAPLVVTAVYHTFSARLELIKLLKPLHAQYNSLKKRSLYAGIFGQSLLAG